MMAMFAAHSMYIVELVHGTIEILKSSSFILDSIRLNELKSQNSMTAMHIAHRDVICLHFGTNEFPIEKEEALWLQCM